MTKKEEKKWKAEKSKRVRNIKQSATGIQVTGMAFAKIEFKCSDISEQEYFFCIMKQ